MCLYHARRLCGLGIRVKGQTVFCSCCLLDSVSTPYPRAWSMIQLLCIVAIRISVKSIKAFSCEMVSFVGTLLCKLLVILTVLLLIVANKTTAALTSILLLCLGV